MLAPTQSQLVAAGSSHISTITAAPPSIAGHLTWRLINDRDGSIIQAESSSGIVEIDDGRDPYLRRYDRPYTAPAAGTYLAIWRYAAEEVAQTIEVSGPVDEIAFASVDDVTAGLQGRALTAGESAEVPFRLNMAAAVIADAAGYDDGWAARLDPVPQLLRLLSVVLVLRTLGNPGEYTTTHERVGSYSYQATRASAPGLALSDAEVLMVRRAVHGRTTDSVSLESSFVRAQDEYWLRKQAARFSDRSSTIL